MHADRAHRHGRVCEPFRQADQIRRDAEKRGRRGSAQTAEGCDDFVENEQDSMPVACFPQAFQVADGRREDAGGAGQWFDDDRGDRVRAMQRH